MSTIIDLSGKKKFALSLATILLVLFAVFVGGELLVRFINPTESMYPRWKFSPNYGWTAFEGTKMVHERPGEWRFEYTINEYQYRGEKVSISNAYTKENIVILGDSYSFGMGVNDGEEYSSILKQELSDYCQIINLSVGGWGLTQQIRRYYEFGQLYSPSAVILQFCGNDPSDNFKALVTTVEGNQFIFHDIDNEAGLVKRFLSHSLIQKSQLYNLFRNRLYWFFTNEHIKENEKEFAVGKSMVIPPKEQFYNDLLEVFARSLKKKGIPLFMIAVNGHLERFPFIKRKVIELGSEGSLEYLEVGEWFANKKDFGSPEGHEWGSVGHRIVGTNLATAIRTRISGGLYATLSPPGFAE